MRLAIIVPDGMADRPADFPSGTTPLEAARKPWMDKLAREGCLGRVVLVPLDVAPGSDVANMAILGLDPREHKLGRASIEAEGRGLTLGDDETVFRMNLVTVQDGLLADYSGGAPTTEEARRYVDAVREALRTEPARAELGVGYRHLLVVKDPAGLAARVSCFPPHDIQGKPAAAHAPRGPEEGVRIVERLQAIASEAVYKVSSAAGTLNDRRPNAVWLWGPGRKARLPNIGSRFGVRGAVVGAVDLVRGIGRAMGMDAPEVPGATGDLDTDYTSKGSVAARALEDHELVFVHIEAPDEAAHRGDADAKRRAIEAIDENIVATLVRKAQALGNVRILVVPDHLTPVACKTHTHGPVPFVLWGPGVKRIGPDSLSERAAESSPVSFERGWELLGAALSGSSFPP